MDPLRQVRVLYSTLTCIIQFLTMLSKSDIAQTCRVERVLLDIEGKIDVF